MAGRRRTGSPSSGERARRRGRGRPPPAASGRPAPAWEVDTGARGSRRRTGGSRGRTKGALRSGGAASGATAAAQAGRRGAAACRGRCSIRRPARTKRVGRRSQRASARSDCRQRAFSGAGVSKRPAGAHRRARLKIRRPQTPTGERTRRASPNRELVRRQAVSGAIPERRERPSRARQRPVARCLRAWLGASTRSARRQRAGSGAGASKRPAGARSHRVQTQNQRCHPLTRPLGGAPLLGLRAPAGLGERREAVLARAERPTPADPPTSISPTPSPNQTIASRLRKAARNPYLRPGFEDARPQQRRGWPSLRARANRESTARAHGPPPSAQPRSRPVQISLSEKPAFSDFALGLPSPWPAALHKRSLCKLGAAPPPRAYEPRSPSGLFPRGRVGSFPLRSNLPTTLNHPATTVRLRPLQGPPTQQQEPAMFPVPWKLAGCSRWSHLAAGSAITFARPGSPKKARRSDEPPAARPAPVGSAALL